MPAGIRYGSGPMSDPDEPREVPSSAAERTHQPGGIPETPEGSPPLGDSPSAGDEGRAPGPTPPHDFWQALYGRRSIRKFKPDAVPRALVEQVLHAGIWAPSSCNYQMWDFVAVDDPALNARLAQLSTQMGNAPVNIVVAYGRDFSEEAWANIQSASAAIQNMSLAAQVLGLGTFWITQTGDREQVRELVGLPEDRLVVAVLALGWPKLAPRAGPKRRPLAQVAHWNHYAGRPIPSSPRPEDWAPDLLALYQRARVLNGLRHNKPRAWEVQRTRRGAGGARAAGRAGRALARRAALQRHRDRAARARAPRLPLRRARAHARGGRVRRRAHGPARAALHVWGASSAARGRRPTHSSRASSASRTARAAERAQLLAAMARWVAPGGHVLLGFVNRRSFHDFTEWLRSRRGGPRGVEYVLAPDPNIGPFESARAARAARAGAGLRAGARGALRLPGRAAARGDRVPRAQLLAALEVARARRRLVPAKAGRPARPARAARALPVPAAAARLSA